MQCFGIREVGRRGVEKVIHNRSQDTARHLSQTSLLLRWAPKAPPQKLADFPFPLATPPSA